MGQKKVNAIVLAAGSGRRMGSEVPKQYLPLAGRPLMSYALEAFQNSTVDEIVLVVAPGEVSYCKEEIVEKYHYTKVKHIVEGGKERYDSVYAGLLASTCDYVLIHDSARAFVDQDIISRSIIDVEKYQACVVGVPSKDTIKVATEEGFVKDTPKRDLVWNIQTPQSFSYELIVNAYKEAFARKLEGITDDAMVVEAVTEQPIKLVMGSYENIKVTTPEDLLIGEQILEKNKVE